MKPLHVEATPTSFKEMIFADDKIKQKSLRLSSQLITNPLLITGCSGIGKSTLAKLIAHAAMAQFRVMYPNTCEPEFTHHYPDAIRPAHYPDKILYVFNPCDEFERDELRDYTAEERYNLLAITDSEHKHLKVSVIDRLNFLTHEQQQTLVSCIDAFRADERNFFIFVSNDLRNTLPEMLAVCDVIDLKRPSVEQITPRLIDIANDYSLPIPHKEQIKRLYKKHNGHIRKILLELELTKGGLWDI